MNLTEKLLSVPQRENAGARTSNRYTYQHVWAFDHMLNLISQADDFVLFMEFHDDVIVIDSATDPKFIDFYQIKTDNKPSGFFSSTKLLSNSKKYLEKMSIAQKLILNFTNFIEETRSIHLVSNKHFDLGDLRSEMGSDTKIPSTNRDSVALHELEEKQIDKIKKGMCVACRCNSCPYSSGCAEKCLHLLHFDSSSLDLSNYQTTVLGTFINFLEDQSIVATTSHARSVYYTILSEIRRINNLETTPTNFDDLIKRKSLTKAQFVSMVWGLEKMTTSSELWTSIEVYLLNDGMGSIEVSKVRHQWQKYHLDSMDVEATSLNDIENDIQSILVENEYDNAVECINYVQQQIATKPYYSVYPKQYFTAIIAKGLYE